MSRSSAGHNERPRSVAQVQAAGVQPAELLALLLFCGFWAALLSSALAAPAGLTLEAQLGSAAARAFILAAAILFPLGLTIAHQVRPSVLLLGHVVAAALMLAAPILTSSDLYLYLLQGRVLGVHGANPYRVSACSIPDEPLLQYVYIGWRCAPSLYGPLWVGVQGAVAAVTSSAPLTALLLFRLIAAVGMLCCLLLLAGAAASERERRTALYLFGWNPLLLLEFANGGHNDIWMMVLGVLAYCALHRGRAAAAVILLLLAGLIKYSYFALLPALCFGIWRRREQGSVRAVYLALALSAAAALLLVHTGSLQVARAAAAHFDIRHPAFWNWHFVLGTQLHYPALTPELLSTFGRVVFLGIMPFILFRRTETPKRWAALLIAFTFLVPNLVLPWYVSWWLPFLLLAGCRRAAVFWTIVGLAAYLEGYSVARALLTLLPFAAAIYGSVLIRARYVRRSAAPGGDHSVRTAAA